MSELLETPKCVKHGDMGNVPALGESHPLNSRQPVVTMQDIISLRIAASELFDMLHKGGYVLIEVVLGDGRYWSRLDMDDPHVSTQLNDTGRVFICPTGKDINGNVALP